MVPPTIGLHEKRAKLICLTTVGETILRHLLRYHLNPDPTANTNEDLANLFKDVGVDTIEKKLNSLNYPCNILKIYKSGTGEFHDEIVIENLDITLLGEIIRKIHILKCIQAGVNLGGCLQGLHGNSCCRTCNHRCVGCNSGKCKSSCCQLLENECRDCDKTKGECLNMNKVHCITCQRCHFCLKPNPMCIGYKLDDKANIIRGELRNTAMHLTNNECMDPNFTFPGVCDCAIWLDVWRKFKKAIKFISKELFNLNYLEEAEKLNISEKIDCIALNDKALYWQLFQDQTDILFMASRNYDDLKDCVTLIMTDLEVVSNNLSVVLQQVVQTTFNVTLETDFLSILSRKLPWCDDREYSDDVLENLLTHIFNREMIAHSDRDNFNVKVRRNSKLIYGWSYLKFDLIASFEHGSLPECYKSRTSPQRKSLCETITIELQNMFPFLAIQNLDLIIKCLIIRFELRRNDGGAMSLPKRDEIIRVLEDAAKNHDSSLQKLLNSNGIKPSTIDVQFAERECNPIYAIDVMAEVTVSENADIVQINKAITKALNKSMEFLEKAVEVSTTEVFTTQKETMHPTDNKNGSSTSLLSGLQQPQPTKQLGTSPTPTLTPVPRDPMMMGRGLLTQQCLAQQKSKSPSPQPQPQPIAVLKTPFPAPAKEKAALQPSTGFKILPTTNQDALKILLQISDERVNIKGALGHTALIFASRYGHIECVKMLLEHNADVNIRNNDGETALIFASTYGHTECVKMLLEHNADVNVRNNDDGETALINATVFDRKECVKMLLEHNADVNIRNNYGTTALISATYYGSEECVKMLLEHNADVNIRNNDGETALISATAYDHRECVKMLLEHNADVNIKNKDDGETALISATVYDHKECVKMLLEHNADVNIKNDDGETALISASKNGRKECVKIILEHNADVNIKGNVGETALISASDNGHEECVRMLLEHNANVNIRNDHGDTAYSITRNNDIKIMISKYQHQVINANLSDGD